MRHDPQAIRDEINAALPVGHVVPEHDDRGHWYRVKSEEHGNPLYPSVTGKLQVLKDPGLANWKMNQALQYVFANYNSFTDDNIMEHIGRAERVSVDIFHDAGDIGTFIHDVRELIFDDWIKYGVRPPDFQAYIDKYVAMEGGRVADVRAVSAIAALEKFCDEYAYTPIVCELIVYSHKWQVGGMLDDLGLMRVPKRKGDPACEHDILCSPTQNVDRCVKCDGKWEWALAALDMKTSNRFKMHYMYQVAMYYQMFRQLTGIQPKYAYIVKLSKENRSYALQELKRPAKIAQYANHLIKVHEGIEFIKNIQKDNQKRVINL